MFLWLQSVDSVFLSVSADVESMFLSVSADADSMFLSLQSVDFLLSVSAEC